MKDTDNFYMVGNMGGALSIGLGAAKAGKNVIVCGGDAEFVMHMGGLTTAGRYKENVKLVYILFDNEANKSTGGQNTYQRHVDYKMIASGANISVVSDTVTNIEDFQSALHKTSTGEGIKFIHVKCGYDDETPRPPIDIVRRSSFR
jgi:phosphonopyruvate decarboxylase